MTTTPLASRSDVVVVGAGLAGLTAALQLRATGRRVTLIHKGIGGLQLSQGSIDILGYAPQRVERPLETVPGYVSDKPEHPYAVIPAGAVRRGVQWLADTLGTDLLVGDADTNVNLPTAVGAVRPTALALPSMMNGVCTADAQVPHRRAAPVQGLLSAADRPQPRAHRASRRGTRRGAGGVHRLRRAPR